MNIVFDLDGTLIDSSERLYRLFQKLIPESKFTKSEYWRLKRDKINHETILNRFFPMYDFDNFEKEWMKKIEDGFYLHMDRLYDDTIIVLEKLGKIHDMTLLTSRQNRIMLYEELEWMGIRKYFKTILVTEQKITKEKLLSGILSGNRLMKADRDLFISDMGADILAGRNMGYKTVGISHGFMSRRRLEEYEPDYLIDELSEILHIEGGKNARIEGK